MGAGRTELLECLFGAGSQPAAGQILLDHRPVRFRHPSQARRAGVAMVCEDRKRLGIFRQLTVRENLSCVRSARDSGGRNGVSSQRDGAGTAVIQRLAIRSPAPKPQ